MPTHDRIRVNVSPEQLRWAILELQRKRGLPFKKNDSMNDGRSHVGLVADDRGVNLFARDKHRANKAMHSRRATNTTNVEATATTVPHRYPVITTFPGRPVKDLMRFIPKGSTVRMFIDPDADRFIVETDYPCGGGHGTFTFIGHKEVF